MRTREWRCGITHSLTHGAACSCAYTTITLINISIVNRFVCRSECNYLPMQAFRLFDSLTHSLDCWLWLCSHTQSTFVDGPNVLLRFFAISFSFFFVVFFPMQLLYCIAVRLEQTNIDMVRVPLSCGRHSQEPLWWNQKVVNITHKTKKRERTIEKGIAAEKRRT